MNLRTLIAAAALLLASCATTADSQPAGNLQLVDLTDDFAELWDRTQQLDGPARLAAFKAHFDPIIPGFYSHERHGMPADQYDGLFAGALTRFPEKREATAAMAQRFASLIRPAERRFGQEFGPLSGFRPIYLVTSLGEFDGGMRTLGGKGYLMFGADVMAELYANRSPQPFLHHELFHLYHTRTFDDCSAVWCNLWNEGLATYVAHRMNPGATDDELLLTNPVPLRQAVEANRQEAVCAVRDRLDSTDRKDNAALFSSGRLSERLPGRFGYYVGYLAAAEAGKTRSLKELAQLGNEEVRPLLEASLRGLADCPSA